MPRGRKQGSWKDLYDIKEVKNEKGKKGYVITEKFGLGRIVSKGVIPTKKSAVEVAKMFLRVQKEAIKSAEEKPKRPRGRPRKMKMEMK